MDLSNSEIDEENVMETLPQWSTKILGIRKSGEEIQMIRLRIAATTVEEIHEWLQQYEEISMCNYSIQTRGKCTGSRVRFKTYLRCQHFTRCPRTYDPNARNRTKNTNCPSQITVTLRTIRETYRRKQIEDPDMPCEIILMPQHNHSTNSVESLRFRRVSKETEEKLMKLFNLGHNPKSALELLKAEIIMNNEDYEVAFADRRFCPSYNHCYYLYTKYVEKKYNPTEKNRKLITEFVNDYNNKTKTSSILVNFVGSEDYVVCFCPPIFRRIHENIAEASEIALLDSFGSHGREKSRVYILFTYSACGELPLAAIITSKESADLLSAGLQVLKDTISSIIFGGNADGPTVFIVNDSDTEQTAIGKVFSNSKCFLNSSCILCEVWKWLRNITNKVHPMDQAKFYGDFKAVMYAGTSFECEFKFYTALKNGVAYPNYQSLLKEFWKRKELWVLLYRNNMIKSDHVNNFSKLMIDLVKKKIFENSKVGNLPNLTNIVVNNLTDYYQSKLMSVTQSAFTSKVILFNFDFVFPSVELIDKIDVMEGIYFIPSDDNSTVYYMVDIEALMCTCTGRAKRICEHLYWIYYLKISEQYEKQLDDINVQNLFYMIGSNNEEPENNFKSSDCIREINHSEQIPNQYHDNDSTEILPCPETLLQENEIHPQTVIVVNPVKKVNVTKPTKKSASQKQTEEEIGVEGIIEEGKQLIQQIANIQHKFLQQSPLETLKLLKNMKKQYTKCGTSKEFSLQVTTGFRKKPEKNQISAIKIKKPSTFQKNFKSKVSSARVIDLAENYLETQQLLPQDVNAVQEHSHYF